MNVPGVQSSIGVSPVSSSSEELRDGEPYLSGQLIPLVSDTGETPMLHWTPAHSHSGCTSSSHATLRLEIYAPPKQPGTPNPELGAAPRAHGFAWQNGYGAFSVSEDPCTARAANRFNVCDHIADDRSPAGNWTKQHFQSVGAGRVPCHRTVSYENGYAHSFALNLNIARRNCNRAGDRVDSGLYEDFSSGSG